MQSRLRISAPFYLIFTKCHFATPTARIYIILFNFQVGNNFDDKKIRVCGFFYFIVRMCRSVDWARRVEYVPAGLYVTTGS